MTKELKQRAKSFFDQHAGLVTGKMLYTEFTDPEVDELRKEGLIEHHIYDEWSWKAD